MGLFSNRSRDRELARVAEIAQRHLDEGNDAFVVPLNLLADGGSISRMRQMRQSGQRVLLSLGLDVIGVEHQEHMLHVANFSVRRRNASADREDDIAVVDSIPLESSLAEDPEELEQMFRQVVEPWAAPFRAAETFGPNYDLEQVMEAIGSVPVSRTTLLVVASAEVDLMVTGIRAGVLDLESYDAVLGIDQKALKAAKVPQSDWDILYDTLEDAKSVVLARAGLQRPEYQKPMSLWSEDDEFRQQVYAYHIVGLGRLGFFY